MNKGWNQSVISSVVVSAFSFLQCFDTVACITKRGHLAHKKTHAIYPVNVIWMQHCHKSMDENVSYIFCSTFILIFCSFFPPSLGLLWFFWRSFHRCMLTAIAAVFWWSLQLIRHLTHTLQYSHHVWPHFSITQAIQECIQTNQWTKTVLHLLHCYPSHLL